MTAVNAYVAGAAVDPAHITVRPLTPDDSEAYRALRRKILEIGDGKYFSDSYDRENHFTTDDQWREWCTEKREHCTIGTFIGNELIGIMGIVMYGPPETLAVEWEATWLDPRYRRFGIARLAYEKVQQWTRDQGYEYAIVFIREENFRSREIREKQGAVFLKTKRNVAWADGSIADVHSFLIDLSPTAARLQDPHKRALRQLASTLAFLKEDGEHDETAFSDFVSG